MAELPGDVIVLPAADGRWALVNLFARTALGVDDSGLAAVRAFERAETVAGRFSVWTIDWFPNVEGLLADPTWLRRVWPEPQQVDAGELRELLVGRAILVDDAVAYRSRFAAKEGLLDFQRFGNFHQQLGQELIVRRREDPDDWWVAQKFTDDLTGVKETLYRAVQQHGLERWIERRFTGDESVVDVGCGPGFYSNRIAATGARVLGVDPNERFLEIARRGAPPTARYEQLPVGQPGALDAIPDGSADVVFMSDALLFYFVPVTPDDRPDIDVLLADVRRILRPGGTFVSVEPHYLFWLQPWFGDADRPWTVLTEYTRHVFRVTPSQSELIQALTRNGLAITWHEELEPDPAYASVDPRGYAFAREFPLWQLYEARHAP